MGDNEDLFCDGSIRPAFFGLCDSGPSARSFRMCSIHIMLFRTLALVLALSVGLAGMASASVNHSSHCVSSTDQTDARQVMSDGDAGQQTHIHVVAEAETADVGTKDCLPHFCAAVLIGLDGCGTGSRTAMLMVVPEPENLRALARIIGLYRPPSL